MTYVTAAACIFFLGGMMLLASAGKFRVLPLAHPRAKDCEFGSSAICLASWRLRIWRACWRSRCVTKTRAGGEEGRASGFAGFTEDIIHSMRGGLLTTDLNGGIILLNRTGEEILGTRFAEVRGRKVQTSVRNFGCPTVCGRGKAFAAQGN